GRDDRAHPRDLRIRDGRPDRSRHDLGARPELTDSRMPTYNALNIPPEAAQDGGDELLRVAVSRATGPAMSLRRGFDDPAMWGHLIADVVKHLAQVYAI